mgnify:CR=1 FL=1
MRRRNRGITLTELLTVVSLITILTSMVTPFLVRVRHAAIGRVCANNLRQLSTALELVRNVNSNNLPACFELNTTDNPLNPKIGSGGYSIKEDSWWYHKLARALNTTVSLNDKRMKCIVCGARVDYMDAEEGKVHCNKPTITDDRSERAGHYVLRCPGSADPPNQIYAPSSLIKVDGIDKDRVYDDCYGYNNFGFRYGRSSDNTWQESPPALPDPNTLKWGSIGPTYYYRRSGTMWGSIKGIPKHLMNPDDTTKCMCGNKWPCRFTRLGESAILPEPARTLLLCDYVKADVAPTHLYTLDGGSLASVAYDGLRGYRFRHGEALNVLFADGHVGFFTKRHLLAALGTLSPETVGGDVSQPLKRKTIHWEVYRP